MERPDPLLETQNDTLTERSVACIIDLVLLAIPIVPLAAFGPPGWVLGLVVFFGYRIGLEATYGQTIGKKLLDIVVVTADGEACDWRTSTVRNVLRVVDSVPFVVPYLLGIGAIVQSDDGQRIGDRVAGTMVTKVEPATDSTADRAASGLLVDEYRQRGEETYLVLKNERDESIDLSEAEISDGQGNRHEFPGNVTIDAGTVEMFHFDAEKQFAPVSGTPLVLHQNDQEQDIEWAAST